MDVLLYRIAVCFGLQGTLKGHLVQTPIPLECFWKG